MKLKDKNKKPTSFKKRYKESFKFSKLHFGDSGMFFCKNYRLEDIYFFELKRKIKYIFKYKKNLKTKKKFWVFLNKNSPISKKSKNARMGKGKGLFVRLCYRLRKNSVFFEFKNVNKIILNKIRKYISKKFFFKTGVLHKI